jgi:hypothetical protein
LSATPAGLLKLSPKAIATALRSLDRLNLIESAVPSAAAAKITGSAIASLVGIELASVGTAFN